MGPPTGPGPGPITPLGPILPGRQFGVIGCGDGDPKSGPNEQLAASDDIADNGTDGSAKTTKINLIKPSEATIGTRKTLLTGMPSENIAPKKFSRRIDEPTPFYLCEI